MTAEERELWLIDRQRGVGGSDWGILTRCSKWGSIPDLYFEKRDGVVKPEPAKLINRIPLERGHLMEPLVARIFAEETGCQVFHNAKNMMTWDPTGLPIFVTPDAMIIYPDGTRGGAEFKYSVGRGIQKWLDEGIPEMYVQQVQMCMHVYGFDQWELAYMLNDDYNHITLYRDQEKIDRLIVVGCDFMNHVANGTIPTIEKEEEWDRFMRTSVKDTSIEASDECMTLLKNIILSEDILARQKADKEVTEKYIASSKFTLKQYMQDNETLTYNGSPVVVYKTIANGNRPFTLKRKELKAITAAEEMLDVVEE